MSPRFDLVGPSYTDQALNADAQSTMNWYTEVVESQDGVSKIILLPTPGLKSFVNLSVQFSIAKSHSGNFTQGQMGASYNVVVKNWRSPQFWSRYADRKRSSGIDVRFHGRNGMDRSGNHRNAQRCASTRSELSAGYDYGECGE